MIQRGDKREPHLKGVLHKRNAAAGAGDALLGSASLQSNYSLTARRKCSYRNAGGDGVTLLASERAFSSTGARTSTVTGGKRPTST